MCEPTTIAALAITAASATANYVQQNQQAKAAGNAAYNNALASNAAIGEQMKQETAQASAQMSARARQALIERGRLAVASGESGLSDNGDRLMKESFFNESTDVASIEANRDAIVHQTQLNGAGNIAQAQGQINMASSRAPSLFSTGLQIAGGSLDVYNKTQGPAASKTSDFDAANYSSNSRNFNLGSTYSGQYTGGH